MTDLFRTLLRRESAFELSSMIVWRFVNGKIAEEWVFFNDLDLYRQLGLFKVPGSTDH